MKIQRVLANDDSKKNQLLDAIQIKLMCLNNLGLTLDDAMMDNNRWESEDKAFRNISMINDLIVTNTGKTYTQLADEHGLSLTQIKDTMKKSDRVMEFYIRSYLGDISKNSSLEIKFELDDPYIYLIANIDKVLPILNVGF